MKKINSQALGQAASSARLLWTRILVPIDFSKTSFRALDSASRIARLVGAKIFLLHVVEPVPFMAGLEGAVLAIPESKLKLQAKEKLSEIARRFVPESVIVASLVAQGRAYDQIVRVASQKQIELIVLTTHGHTGVNRLVMGSVAEKVVRRAPCDTLVVRSNTNRKRVKLQRQL